MQRILSQPSPTRMPSDSGMTLLEVLMAIMLLAIGSAGICALAVSANRSSTMARHHYQATNLAMNRIENARVVVEVQGIAGLTNMAESGTILNDMGDSDSAGRFMRTTIISNTSPTLKEMIVTVRIKDNQTADFSTNSTHCEIVSTYFAQTL